MSMIDYVTTATTKYIEQMPKAQRKKYGQFFTSKETAVFMAELFDLQSVSGPVSILDPGAGSGILSTALIERMQRVASITKIELVCYESDTNILELLRSNLDWVCDHATKKIEYKIISDNYILSQVADYNHMLWESPNSPTLLPQSASVMSSTRRTDTPAKYISMSASSTLLSLRLYRSMMAVSKLIPFSRGT